VVTVTLYSAEQVSTGEPVESAEQLSAGHEVVSTSAAGTSVELGEEQATSAIAANSK